MKRQPWAKMTKVLAKKLGVEVYSHSQTRTIFVRGLIEWEIRFYFWGDAYAYLLGIEALKKKLKTGDNNHA